MKQVICSLILLFGLHETGLCQQASIQAQQPNEKQSVNTNAAKKHTLNFFIISKRKKGRLDLATRFNIVRTKIKSLLRPKKFVSIIADNAEQMSAKVLYRLEKNNATLGTIWFDSHGMYKKGYGLFFIGHDEISRRTLADSNHQLAFRDLAPYMTTESRIILGSCYAGATYSRASIDYKDTTRMDGDSLMMTLGSLMENGTVYASESWVMTKPGLFNRKAATGGYPGRKLFRDLCYQPAWSHVGIWNQYSVRDNEISRINTISLDPDGNLVVRAKPWLEEKKKDKVINRNLNNLKPGLYH
ncbi:MAG: hypothetical protein IPP93_04215 [Chitinophagaceae bacterium]|nr:hypothetical protein [Chitinophagaceae bacterium]